MKRNRRGVLLATAVAALFVASPAIAAHHESGEGHVKCEGGNACKGQGVCAGEAHECAGKNECKGKGWTKSESKEACEEAGGTVKES